MEYNVDYSKVDKQVRSLIKKTQAYMTFLEPDEIKQEIQKAYVYARDAHHGQMRLSGDPYIIHPVEASIILLGLKPDIFTIQACILHDVIEDTDREYEDIKEVFWKQVAELCIWMEKLSKVRYSWEDRNVGSLRKMFVAMADDLRVIFIKLADRLHNMRTLKHHPKPEKRKRIALETLNIYAPIADRLGLFHLKNDLEEECFKLLEPKAYRKLKKELKELNDSSAIFITHSEKEIHNILNGIVEDYEIDVRVKSIYSIHKKMLKKWLDSAKSLHDLFGLRITVHEVSDCYKALWAVHNNWKPIPQKFKDYIALPKPNGYKSLHTTVIGILKKYRKQPTEIQIKTYAMREFSDIWVAAHFEYKEKWSKKAKDIDWVKELKDLTENLENNDFMNSLKIDIFKDRIFVFTPNGDSVNLPYGSSAIDFAYHLHSDLWNHMAIAKVNNKVYPLDKELHNGDVIEIVIDKKKSPNPFWLSFVKTSKAKQRIRSFLNKENKDFSRERWKDIFNKYLIKSNFPELDKDMSLLKMIDGHENTMEQRWNLLEQVWNFSATAGSVFKRILKTRKDLLLEYNDKQKQSFSENILDNEVTETNSSKARVIVWWEPELPYILCSKCCNKKVPKRLVAHINSSGVIKVHSRKCHILEEVNKERLLSAQLEWTQEDTLISKMEFIFKNQPGILRDLTDIIYSMDLNIEKISSRKKWKSSTAISLEIAIPDHEFLIIDRLLDRIKINLWERLLKTKVAD